MVAASTIKQAPAKHIGAKPFPAPGIPRPGRPYIHIPSDEEWRAQPLEKHVESLRYGAARIGKLLEAEILTMLARSGKKPVADIRSQSISFGIMMDKASQQLQSSAVQINLPGALTDGLQLLIAVRATQQASNTAQPIDIPSTTAPGVGDMPMPTATERQGGHPCDTSTVPAGGSMGPSTQPPV